MGVTTVSGNVDWVKDVCVLHLPLVSQQGDKLYAVGGYTYLRSPTNSSTSGAEIANSYLYSLDFSSSFNLQKNYAPIFTSVSRLPDFIPRLTWANFLWRDSTVNLFGGSQTFLPIFRSNGSYDLRDRVNIGDGLWSYDTNNANWTWSRPYGATNGKPIGQASKAFDANGDNGRGVLWFYGGGYGEEAVEVGTELKGSNVDMVEYSDLWRMPGDCGTSNKTAAMTACKQNTITSSTSTVTRPNLRGTMVWVDNTRHGTSAEGLLVLFGGHIGGNTASLRNVHVYDVATATWYTQPTTAENDHFPSDRREASAVVGKAADGSSYNIYMHGGIDGNSTVLGGIWILTLPTFHWIHSPIGTENTRVGHSCSKVQEKFMVIFGGIPGLGDIKCDDFTGIQVVDLETLQWVTKVDVVPNLAYMVPDLVSKVIGGGATGGASYTSPQNGFNDTKLYDVFNVTSANSLPHSITPSSNPKKLPTGTILGGVFGGLVFIIAILALTLWLLKRRRKEQVAPPMELGSTGVRSEMAAREALAAELPSYPYEEQGGSQHKEEDKLMPIQKMGETDERRYNISP